MLLRLSKMSFHEITSTQELKFVCSSGFVQTTGSLIAKCHFPRMVLLNYGIQDVSMTRMFQLRNPQKSRFLLAEVI